MTVIRHVIITIQENRSFDHYFGRLGQYRSDHGFTGAFDGVPLDATLFDRAGLPVHPYHHQTVCTEGLTPAWGASHVDVDGGKMDKFMTTANHSTIDPTGTRAMGYVDWTDLPYYYEAATQFATSDRFFSPLLGPTLPSRLYVFAATSFGNITPDIVIPASAVTIFDKLSAAGISWKYYIQDAAFDTIRFFPIAAREPQNIRPVAEYYAAAKNDTLPQVVFIDRALGRDEHPMNNIQRGAARIKQLVDAVMNGPAWSSSVFFLTWDEGGGFYDHVPPITVPKPDGIPPMLTPVENKPGDFDQSGFRVPLIVFSPWVKAHYVSHVPREMTSIIKFVEHRFGLTPLTARDAWADDMTEMFDFSAPQWMTPPKLPDQPTNGACSFDLEKPAGR